MRRVAKEIVDHRIRGAARARPVDPNGRSFTLDDFFAQDRKRSGVRELRRPDQGATSHGSVEALRDALLKLSTDADQGERDPVTGVGAPSPKDRRDARQGQRRDHSSDSTSAPIRLGRRMRPNPQGVDIRATTGSSTRATRRRDATPWPGLLPPTISGGVREAAPKCVRLFAVPRRSERSPAAMVDRRGSSGAAPACRLLRDGVQVYEGKISLAQALQGRRRARWLLGLRVRHRARRATTTSRSAT